jgi:hypothetical protein
MDSIRLSSYSASPIVNGLSDHDAQCLMTDNAAAAGNLTSLKQRRRKVNSEEVRQFSFL